jgi:hypothetical protein
MPECALDVGQVSNLRGGWLPPPVHLQRASGPITNRPQLTKLPHKVRSAAQRGSYFCRKKFPTNMASIPDE